MQEMLFNPFEDRLSRDIRNDLSSGFAKAIETGESKLLKETLEKYRTLAPDNCYLHYILERETKYQKALAEIGNKIDAPIAQAVVLWNHGLFFEVHEVLEHAWYSAEGQMKATLQALIRAAGVYIKLEYKFVDSAVRIAAKAVPVLKDNTGFLEKYFQPTKLITALEEVSETSSPPHLQIS